MHSKPKTADSFSDGRFPAESCSTAFCFLYGIDTFKPWRSLSTFYNELNDIRGDL